MPFHASLLKWSRHPILYELCNEASIIDRGAPGRDRKKREFDLVFMIIVWEPLNTSIMITLILPSIMHSSSGTISKFRNHLQSESKDSTLKKWSSCVRQPMPRLLTSNPNRLGQSKHFLGRRRKQLRISTIIFRLFQLIWLGKCLLTILEFNWLAC